MNSTQELTPNHRLEESAFLVPSLGTLQTRCHVPSALEVNDLTHALRFVWCLERQWWRGFSEPLDCWWLNSRWSANDNHCGEQWSERVDGPEPVRHAEEKSVLDQLIALG